MVSITPIPAFTDNYIWLLHDHSHAVVVDPGSAAPVLAALAELKLQLSAILITHRHADHIGGVAELSQPGLPIFGPATIAVVNRPVLDGDQFTIPGIHIDARVLAVPGHTSEHIAYRVDQHCFCGDTLFAAGCGRVMDGDPAALHHSLQLLASLPDDTLFYPAHEYTLANLRFARAAEGAHAALLERQNRDQQSRNAGRPTLPTSVHQERATNPFLRDNRQLRQHLQQSRGIVADDSLSLFIGLREWKNEFRG